MTFTTDREIQALKPRGSSYYETYGVRKRGAGNLVVEVSPRGTKTFYLRYYPKAAKVPELIKIGVYAGRTRGTGGMTLADALEVAEPYRKQLRAGLDPKEELARAEEARKREQAAREAERLRGSFGQLLASYLAQMEADGKSSHEHVRTSLERYVERPFPKLLKKAAAEVTVADVRTLLAAMIDAGVTTHTNRVRSYLHAAFNHGIRQDNDPRSYLPTRTRFDLTMNPVTAIPRQESFESVGERVLSEEEVRLVWHDGFAAMGPIVGAVVRLALCTGIRPHELIGSPWTCFDLDDGVLLITKRVGKDKQRDHLIALDALAVETMRELRRVTGDCGFAFAGRRGNVLMTDRALRPDSVAKKVQRFSEDANPERPAGLTPFTPRDIRRTWKTHAGRAGISKTLRDRMQCHALHDVSSKHYDRYDYLAEKREGARVWNAYLTRIIADADNVIPLRKPG